MPRDCVLTESDGVVRTRRLEVCLTVGHWALSSLWRISVEEIQLSFNDILSA